MLKIPLESNNHDSNFFKALLTKNRVGNDDYNLAPLFTYTNKIYLVKFAKQRQEFEGHLIGPFPKHLILFLDCHFVSKLDRK